MEHFVQVRILAAQPEFQVDESEKCCSQYRSQAGRAVNDVAAANLEITRIKQGINQSPQRR